MNNGAAFTGGAGDDTFIATAATVATNTLNAGDNLTGGEGTDTLSLLLLLLLVATHSELA